MKASIGKQRAAFARTKGICIICGRPLSNDEGKWSPDHFIPRAIYKWVPSKRTQSLIESAGNIFVVHQWCNFDKDSALPTKQSISRMHASKDILDDMRELYKATEDSIVAYRAIKQSTLDSQGRRCKICGRRLTLNGATLRRIDNRKERTRENAMCLCRNCNRKAASTSQKERMLGNASKRKRNHRPRKRQTGRPTR